MNGEQNDDEQLRLHQGYTVEGAARALGLSPFTVRGAIREGKLRATLLGRQYTISRQAVEEYRRDHLGRKGWKARREKDEE
jgi:excisionase family DNA binding protein